MSRLGMAMGGQAQTFSVATGIAAACLHSAAYGITSSAITMQYLLIKCLRSLSAKPHRVEVVASAFDDYSVRLFAAMYVLISLRA